MEAIRVSYEYKCDFVDFVRRSSKPDILGMCEKLDGAISTVDIYINDNSLSSVSEIISEYIGGPYRKHLALSYLTKNHPFISDKEAEGIVSSLPEFKPDNLKEVVSSFLKENDRMDIPGFVRFRLPSFRRNMIIDTEHSAEEFFKAEEFQQMVALLKNLSKAMPPHEGSPDTMDVTFEDENSCTVTDNEGRLYDISSPEMLAGFLVELIPQKIVLHNYEIADPVLIALLQSIFEERLMLCKGCNICKN